MLDRVYSCYIVASKTGTLYTGMTNNLYKRALQHKAGEIEGFSKQYDCNRLVWHQGYATPIEAINREKQVKGWRRSKKIALIEGANKRWQDLAENWGYQMVLPGETIAEFQERQRCLKRLGSASQVRTSEGSFARKARSG